MPPFLVSIISRKKVKRMLALRPSSPWSVQTRSLRDSPEPCPKQQPCDSALAVISLFPRCCLLLPPPSVFWCCLPLLYYYPVPNAKPFRLLLAGWLAGWLAHPYPSGIICVSSNQRLSFAYSFHTPRPHPLPRPMPSSIFRFIRTTPVLRICSLVMCTASILHRICPSGCKVNCHDADVSSRRISLTIYPTRTPPHHRPPPFQPYRCR